MIQYFFDNVLSVRKVRCEEFRVKRRNDDDDLTSRRFTRSSLINNDIHCRRYAHLLTLFFNSVMSLKFNTMYRVCVFDCVSKINVCNVSSSVISTLINNVFQKNCS